MRDAASIGPVDGVSTNCEHEVTCLLAPWDASASVDPDSSACERLLDAIHSGRLLSYALRALPETSAKQAKTDAIYAAEAASLAAAGHKLLNGTHPNPPEAVPPDECWDELRAILGSDTRTGILLTDRVQNNRTGTEFPRFAKLINDALAVGYALAPESRINQRTSFLTGALRLGFSRFEAALLDDERDYAQRLLDAPSTRHMAFLLREHVRVTDVIVQLATETWVLVGAQALFDTARCTGRRRAAELTGLAELAAYIAELFPQLWHWLRVLPPSLPPHTARPPPEPKTPQLINLVRVVLTAAPPPPTRGWTALAVVAPSGHRAAAENSAPVQRASRTLTWKNRRYRAVWSRLSAG
ncbi:hypothetical protein [Streptomyces sp. NPDC051561]|uniref:hypothetical protein n=1 Tax=Streptomyces sp. NPDC051561 TaxID=3365658 RepID=UPI0037AC09A6